MKAVQYFLNNTSLRHCKKRDKLVQLIQNQMQPMRFAKNLAAKYPKIIMLVDWERFYSDLNKLHARKGLPDPVFARKILEAEAAVFHGTWTVDEHIKLFTILKNAWVPWSKEDIAMQKAQARMRKYAV